MFVVHGPLLQHCPLGQAVPAQQSLLVVQVPPIVPQSIVHWPATHFAPPQQSASAAQESSG